MSLANNEPASENNILVPGGISVIVCTHNGAERIIPTLEALAGQNIPDGLDWEIIVVDNGSTDDTETVVVDFGKYRIPELSLRIIFQPVLGKANALIAGYNGARFELMVLCDDDNWLQPEYLKTVLEIYTEHPDIGLLGGYGKAVFEPGTKPPWFDSWENSFVCGEQHPRNGFLKSLDYTIWGAGSALRKTMWNFLFSNGFIFINSMIAGKPMTEDAELALAVTLTGHKLYYDKRLWFYHDFRGGRITWKNFLHQQSKNDKNNAVLVIYLMAYYHGKDDHFNFNQGLFKYLLKSALFMLNPADKKKYLPEITSTLRTNTELIMNIKKYENLYHQSKIWVNKIKDILPLNA